MNILIAPNAFKTSLAAQYVAESIAAGLKQSKLDCVCHVFPVADGGDGTGNLLIDHLHGTKFTLPAYDALSRNITAGFGLIDGGQTAVIEMADAAGIRLLDKTDLRPLKATTYGAGLLIKAALDAGVNKIIMGMGGSATVDGGAGILNALGVKFLNADRAFLKAAPQSLSEISTIDMTGLDKRLLACDIFVLCDVDNKLIGPNGAAAVFGPQKGANPAQIKWLDTYLKHFAALAKKATGKSMTAVKRGGAAGGAAAGMYAFFNAHLVSGADYFLDITGFDKALNNADIVITGEGSIDDQTLQGKAPAVVALRAKQKGVKVIGLAGKIPSVPGTKLKQYFDELICINKEPIDMPSALKNTAENLKRAAFELGNRLADA